MVEVGLSAKKATDGPFEMYTDINSKITQYNKIRGFFRIVLVMEVICFFIDLIATINTGSYNY